jgi:hypothetical protein
MRQDVKHQEVFARPESLGEDFVLIFEAFADAFRGSASTARQDCRCPTIHYAGWR